MLVFHFSWHAARSLGVRKVKEFFFVSRATFSYCSSRENNSTDLSTAWTGTPLKVTGWKAECVEVQGWRIDQLRVPTEIDILRRLSGWTPTAPDQRAKTGIPYQRTYNELWTTRGLWKQIIGSLWWLKCHEGDVVETWCWWWLVHNTTLLVFQFLSI